MWGAADWDQEEFEEVKRGPGVRILDLTTREPSEAEWWPMTETESVLDLRSRRLLCHGDLTAAPPGSQPRRP